MTIPVPLSVRVKTPRMDRHITRDLVDLSFRTVVPGGFASARFSLHRPLNLEPEDIRQLAQVYIYDGGGQVVWEGRLEDPGRSAGNNGQVWEVSALGPSTHARDRTAPLIYVDTRLSELVPAIGSGSAHSVGTKESSHNDDGALAISVGRGNVAASGSFGAATYNAIYAAGQDLALVSVSCVGGFSGGDTKVELRTCEDFGATTTVVSTNISTVPDSLSGSLGGAFGTAFTAGHNRFLLVVARPGFTITVPDENYFAEFYSLTTLGTRLNADGTAVTSYPGVIIDASDVVKDLLGRLLPQYDGANASIPAVVAVIDHMVYPDGATPEKVLADIMAIAPTYLWEALESNSAGKHRFNFRAWPTNVRYEADLTDGYSSTGAAGDLYNAVVVRWRDTLGRIQTVRRTQTVEAFVAAGYTREAFIDLGDEVASLDGAETAGDQFLGEHATSPVAGRLTIARRIFDADAGRWVDPWEIRPGYLIRVRGLEPKVSALSATARDGSTTFKIVATDYSVSEAAVQLELDSSPPSIARLLGDIISIRPPGPWRNPIRRR